MPVKKGGLGKGLGALMSEVDSGIINGSPEENKVIFIDINKISPNRKQPRKTFDEESLSELAESIRLHGIIQPISVKSTKNGYEIIAGERRWRASRLAGLKEVPCIIKKYSEKDNILVALIENLQRENLNPMEEAAAYCYVADNFNMTQEEISKNVGKSRSYIANALRLQKLPQEIQEMIVEGKLSAGHGRTLLGLNNPAKQYELAIKITEKGLSVRETEAAVAEILNTTNRKSVSRNANPELKEIENRITENIGTKVKIKEKNDKGTIQLSFYSREELERLIAFLSGSDKIY